jgi:acetyltransferase-like isoleucine patch superfamily enzyme
MHFGDGVAIGAGSHLSARQGTLTIGSDTSLNTNVCLGADFGTITIGRDVLIAMNVVMRSANHRFDRSPEIAIRAQGHVGAPIVIGDDVWIGANAVITAGARVGNHCIIGAGSVVTGDIPDGSIAVGVPARVVRSFGGKAQDVYDAH